MLVEVLKIFEIYLHQFTPEALIKVGVFIWAMRIQGLEPDANCFCNIHELSYQTKAVGKEQYHNNFRCYSFVYRSDARCPMPTFWKKWSSSWMKQWFYVKNDLSEREDVKGIIQRPIHSHFVLGRRRTRHPSLYAFVHSSLRRRLHQKNVRTSQRRRLDGNRRGPLRSRCCNPKALSKATGLPRRHRYGRPMWNPAHGNGPREDKCITGLVCNSLYRNDCL
jgi:hypothetical protein